MRHPLTRINPSRDPLAHDTLPRPDPKPMNILLPVDGSEYTRRMLSYIAAHDELLGPGHAYTMLTVIPQIPVYAARFIDKTTLDGYYAERSADVFKPLHAFAKQSGWKVDLVHQIGHAAECIAAYAKQHKIDLIVMGTHGHGALGNAVLGSVTSGVLGRCSTPVLLVR